jgi:hypothetical protein
VNDEHGIGTQATVTESAGSSEGPGSLTRGLDQRFRSVVARPEYRFIGLFLITLAVFAMYRPLRQPVSGDPSIYNYIAQSILRGQVPYRDVVDIKGPVSYYISAAAMLIGRAAGIGDVGADRLIHGAMLGLLVWSVFELALGITGSGVAGLIASAFLLMSSRFIEWMALGGQPKMPMLLLGIISLLLLQKDRPFFAGFCSALSGLCWQPALLFLGATFLVSSRYLTRWRDRRGLMVLAGAVVPVGTVLLFLYLAGALGSFWAYAIRYNYSVFGPAAAVPLARSVGRLWTVTTRVMSADVIAVFLAGAGWVLYVADRLRSVPAVSCEPGRALLNDAIAISPLVYLGFCLVNFQSGPDLILFYPFIGVYGGYLLVGATRLIAKARSGTERAAQAIPVGVAIIMLLLALGRGLFIFRDKSNPFQAEKAEAMSVQAVLGPDGKVYAHGSVELLVLLDRPNLNPYVCMDWGMDDFICARKYGGSFQRLIDEMDGQAPKIVAASRLNRVNHTSDLRVWLSEHYDKVSIDGYDLFERRSTE